MVRGMRLFLGIIFVGATVSVAPNDIALLLETFLSQGGQEWSVNKLFTDIKSLDFYTTNRISIALPAGVSLGFDLGGAGCGSPFLPFPQAQRLYFDWNREQPSDAGDQAKTALLKVLQDQLFGALGGASVAQTPVDFFAEGDQPVLKQHPLEKMFNFKITPGIVWTIKFGLLLKHMGQSLRNNNADNRFMQGFSYLVDFGVLTIRLLRSLNRDKRSAGGISTVLDERLPVVGQILRELSTKYIPESQNPDHNPLFLHRKIDGAWKLIIDGDGILFGADGSVQRGLGFAVTGLECRNQQEAELLNAFLNQKQINWDSIETQTMITKPFVVRVATLLQMYTQQLQSLPEVQRANRIKDAARLQDIVQDLVLRNAQRSFGRYDLDPNNNVGVHPQLASTEFSSLIGSGRAIDSYTALPVVTTAGKWVYFCTNQTGPLEAGKLVAVIFFQALWKYLEVIRGSKEIDNEITAKVREKERSIQSAQAYLQTGEACFLQLPLGLLLERPTVDYYALALKFIKDKEANLKREELVENLIACAKINHGKAAARVGNIYKKCLEQLHAKRTGLVPNFSKYNAALVYPASVAAAA
jgi:hypothetical protein